MSQLGGLVVQRGHSGESDRVLSSVSVGDLTGPAGSNRASSCELGHGGPAERPLGDVGVRKPRNGENLLKNARYSLSPLALGNKSRQSIQSLTGLEILTDGDIVEGVGVVVEVDVGHGRLIVLHGPILTALLLSLSEPAAVPILDCFGRVERVFHLPILSRYFIRGLYRTF